MPHAAHISAWVVLLVAIASSDPQESSTIHITGPTQVIVGSTVPTAEQCSGEGGRCIETGDRCNGTTKNLQTSCNDHCTCCVPEHEVPAAEQCTGEGGLCVETGDRCYGDIKMLHNSCNDHCTCCIPDRCPGHKGFFTLPESSQCLKVFMRNSGNWTVAEAFCKAQGLELAKPDDPVGVQKYLHRKYVETFPGNTMYWVGGRGDGSSFRWQRDGEVLDPSSPWWYPGHPKADRLSTDHCLRLDANDEDLRDTPGQPYVPYDCTYWNYPLCEMIME